MPNELSLMQMKWMFIERRIAKVEETELYAQVEDNFA